MEGHSGRSGGLCCNGSRAEQCWALGFLPEVVKLGHVSHQPVSPSSLLCLQRGERQVLSLGQSIGGIFLSPGTGELQQGSGLK